MFKSTMGFFLAATLIAMSILPSQSLAQQEGDRKVVLIAGPKSHPAMMHEYIKSVRLLKVMLDEVAGIKAEIVYNGWPEDESILDDADAIMTLSDGQDGHLGHLVPFMEGERMEKMAALMARGVGFVTFHFSTFAPDRLSEQILDWGGGYFDWQNDDGAREWYSAITTTTADVTLPSPRHPIARGVKPYRILEEFYYNIRFPEDQTSWMPLLEVPALGSPQPHGNVVAWAVERSDGGRGFGTTTGHFYAAWKHDAYRKFMLNAIMWTAGAEVPEEGVVSRFYTDREVTRKLFGTERKGLILTGHNHPAHNWQATTAAISDAIEADHRIHIDISTDIEDLHQYDLRDFDFLVLNYANWQQPDGLSDASKKALVDYLESGGGLLVVHFANGAFHASLPEAEASDWPEYRSIVRRIWDHNSDSGHDAYGAFTVNVTDVPHEITAGIGSFSTTDELYYQQKGEESFRPLLTALSKDTGKDEPLAWVYQYGRGRVFQTVLGHDEAALRTPEVQTILLRAAHWAADGYALWNGL